MDCLIVRSLADLFFLHALAKSKPGADASQHQLRLGAKRSFSPGLGFALSLVLGPDAGIATFRLYPSSSHTDPLYAAGGVEIGSDPPPHTKRMRGQALI